MASFLHGFVVVATGYFAYVVRKAAFLSYALLFSAL